MEDAKQMRRMRQYKIVLLLISAHALTGVRSDEVSEALELGEGPKQQRKCKVQDHGEDAVRPLWHGPCTLPF